MDTPTVRLANGVEMPSPGFGTWELRNDAEGAVGAALASGYRHIDTASMYGNEAAVGAAVRGSGLDRADVFVTTKIWNSDHGYDRSREALNRSRQRLDLDPLDLVLIHWPGGRDRLDTWRQLEERLADGSVRAIGVANYDPSDIDELVAVSDVVPMVNQIEFNPMVLARQRPTLARCAELGIQVTGWQPLIKGRSHDHPVLASAARRHNRSPAQILLRWSMQHGVVPLPKSSRPERIRSNFAVFDFELSRDDMVALDAMR